MGDDTADAVADPKDPGPDHAEDASSADASQGSEGRDHEEAQADESSARNHPDSADEDDFLKALAGGTLDEIDVGRDGKAHKSGKKVAEKPDAQAEGEPEATAETVEPGDESEPAAEGEPEATGDEEKPDETEQALLERARTKQQRKDLEKIFAERKKLRTDLKVASEAKQFADNVIEHAKTAGLTTATELGTLIEQEKFLRSAPKDKAAEYLRKLADSFDPPKAAPEPIRLDEKLQDAVDAGFLSKEDAEVIARAKAPAKPAAKPEQQPNPPDPQAAARAEEQTGYKAIADIAAQFKAKHAANWSSIRAEVEKLLQPRLADLKVSAWGKEAKRVIQEVIERRKAASVRKPTRTTAPRGTAPPAADGIESEEEELEALTKGRLT